MVEQGRDQGHPVSLMPDSLDKVLGNPWKEHLPFSLWLPLLGCFSLLMLYRSPSHLTYVFSVSQVLKPRLPTSNLLTSLHNTGLVCTYYVKLEYFNCFYYHNYQHLIAFPLLHYIVVYCLPHTTSLNIETIRRQACPTQVLWALVSASSWSPGHLLSAKAGKNRLCIGFFPWPGMSLSECCWSQGGRTHALMIWQSHGDRTSTLPLYLLWSMCGVCVWIGLEILT